MKIIDSHVHFVDPARPEGVVWPASDSPLFRPLLPEDYVSASIASPDTGCILVETSRRPIDDDWLLHLAQSTDLIKGVVLNLQPDMPGFSSRLEAASLNDKFVGIRLRPIEYYDLCSLTLQKSLSLLNSQHKTIEFGAKTVKQKKVFASQARRHPGITWILDHGGHPPRNGKPDADWLMGIREIANLPNAVAKVTPVGSNDAGFQPALDQLVECFGTERLLYGSNWPVCDSNHDITGQIQQLGQYFDAQASQFFYSNVKRVYRLEVDGKDQPQAGSTV